MIQIDLTGRKALEKEFKKLDNVLQKEIGQIMAIGAEAAMIRFDEIVRTTLPPPVRKQKAAQYWTAKQKRWWWYTMRQKALGKTNALPGWRARYVKRGKRNVLTISGSYRRTGTMVRSLTYRLEGDGLAVVAFYGTNTPYAPYVIGEADQSKYHAGNWTVLEQFQRENAAELNSIFEKTVTAEISKRLA